MSLTAREIYRLARDAGFAPGQAVTMTAIALAESGGDTHAHNPRGENSQGLWQINARSHPWARDLYDPATNAAAAYRVSHGGEDISPWTVTHGGASARYLRYQEKAQAAAEAAGDGAGLGNFDGVRGYGDHESADGAADSQGGESALQTFLSAALAQRGDSYVFGAQAKISDPDPDEFDCSELTRWAAGQAGVDLQDGAANQYLQLKKAGALVPIDQAERTPGALLFSFSTEPTPGGGRPKRAHVAISLGDGRTVEARNPQDDIGTFEAGDRFTYAAVIPGLTGAAGTTDQTAPALSSAALMSAAAVDTDADGISDELEKARGLDPRQVDTDRDNLSDFYELAVAKTDPLSADTDHDGVVDSVELGLGLDPLSPDSDRDGHLDAVPGATPTSTDTDHDGLDDDLEKILHTGVGTTDTDRDGFLDGAEYVTGFDPTDPSNNPLTSTPQPLPGADSHQMADSYQAAAHHPLTDPIGHGDGGAHAS